MPRSFCFISFSVHDQPHGQQQYCQKAEADSGEQQQETARLSGDVLCVLPESDETGQRRHQRSCPADVDAYEQSPVIISKLAQQYSGRDVADDLAG